MKLEDLFAASHCIPSVPKIVQELIESLRNDDVSVPELARKIEADQGMTSKLLRLANSPHYHASRRIGTIEDAIKMLGFSTIRTLVISTGLTSGFKKVDGVDLLAFWRHSLRVAAVARHLAKKSDQGLDDNLAFTVGLMHAVGHLVMTMSNGSGMDDINKEHAIHSKDRIEAEEGKFGYHFADVSAELASRWHFAPEFQTALSHLNCPMDRVPFDALTGALHLAVWRVAFDESNENPNKMFDDWPADVAQALGISTEDMRSVSVKDLARDLESMLG